MRLTLAQMAQMLGVTIPEAQADICITSVSRDARQIEKGCLFVCIEGQNFDGHTFAAEAVQKGAAALLVARPLEHITVPQLVISESLQHDTVQALGCIAHGWRKLFKGKVIVLTGSAGKTTLKEVLAQCLEPYGKVTRSIMNYNNQIGLPLSMLATTGQEDFWVMEAGISQAHDMDALASIAQADVALVLNVGAAHTEGLGLKGVAHYKSRIFAHMADGGIGIACADYKDLMQEIAAYPQHILQFTAENAPDAVVRATYLHATGEHGVYAIAVDGKEYMLQSPFVGTYGAENVAAIASIVHALGLDMAALQTSLASAKLPQQRFQTHNHGAWTLIDDSYNANPLSMQRMLQAALEKAKGAPCYAVLGYMGELGDAAYEAHVDLGRFIGSSAIQVLIWKGDCAEAVKNGLDAAHYQGTFMSLENHADADAFMRAFDAQNLQPGVIIYKGSRSNGLEKYAQALLQRISVSCVTTPANAQERFAQKEGDAHVV